MTNIKEGADLHSPKSANMFTNFSSVNLPALNRYLITEKNPGMYSNKIRLLQQESDWWKRQLSSLQAENTHLKNRLADIAAHELNTDRLAEVENFQHLFIREDEMIALTKRDVYDFDKWISHEFKPEDSTLDSISSRQRKLRSEIEVLEQKFNKLKFEFANYVADNF